MPTGPALAIFMLETSGLLICLLLGVYKQNIKSIGEKERESEVPGKGLERVNKTRHTCSENESFNAALADDDLGA
jgi:hypothetical protein